MKKSRNLESAEEFVSSLAQDQLVPAMNDASLIINEELEAEYGYLKIEYAYKCFNQIRTRMGV